MRIGVDGLAFSDSDDPPADLALAVDTGLDAHNQAAAPLADVKPLASFASDAAGRVVGGAVGRTWGRCCELQQLWVEPGHRGNGVASRLLERFEARAGGRGCDVFYLTTLSFQAPAFYRKRGYAALAEISGYPDGIAKYLMQKTTPRTFLRPMRPDTYPAYLEAAIAGYAEDNVAAGRWPRVGALERSRDDFASLLPDGLRTPGQSLYEIVDDEAGPPVGFVWCAIETRHGACTAYVYDLEVRPEHRRKGHALRAMRRLEAIAAAAGATSIGLNVFASSAGAQALYRKLGYTPTNVNMRKPLPAPA